MIALLQTLASVWTVQILRLLSQGAYHFSALKRRVPGISAKVLTTRLRELEGLGLVNRKVIPSSPPTVQYELTAKGARIFTFCDQLDELASLQQVSEKPVQLVAL